MLLRFTNTLMLGLIVILGLSGAFGLIWNLQAWPLEIHRWAGWILIALIPWKSLISFRSIRRGLLPNFERGGLILLSLALAATTLFVVWLGVAWLWRLGPQVLWPGYSVMTLHWILGLVLLIPLSVHVWHRWPRPKNQDFVSRRGLLRIGGLTLAGFLAWQLDDQIGAALGSTQPRKRLTGSRERGSFTGNAFPVTTNPGNGRVRIEKDQWRLQVTGRVEQTLSLGYAELDRLPHTELVTPLDCTVGWYSVQRWTGVPLDEILNLAKLAPGARFVRLLSIEGYSKEIGIEEANTALLATHVGGEVLSHQHGFPVRLVLPRRRGWFWVKWLEKVVVSDVLHDAS